ncbi:DUF4177 domain-containing protein [Cognatilysobacter bugurensis]|uniref:DUF4177 domain-containing protein n=1 Tax=Cognatilysobacter bugurensis TaxID=543356 RepID=A0A918W674_9GAMM|nr:DUF4177 domain-containing protein [Lysobacter bugurensis]GHA69296.1 hypothetical protein GCM10007067_01530 [Lysobacter bugurensis]
MKSKWIYNVVEIRPGFMGRVKPEHIQEELNRQGAQGWELVNIAFSAPTRPCVAVFKKEQ